MLHLCDTWQLFVLNVSSISVGEQQMIRVFRIMFALFKRDIVVLIGLANVVDLCSYQNILMDSSIDPIFQTLTFK